MSLGLGAPKEKVKGSREDKGYSTGCADIGNVIKDRLAVIQWMYEHRKCL
ncbi:hypothetical protein N475_21270 [Pseudoalteromonas luteoviolacea DSM 6061]|uniref:Uncharacterized protein n=1 Tax=Pseudoalteromonas luteoviolacea DSM 6061 TaxID=1365250 RepID=A0A166VGF0_9GAMM|nr:hypothetical protein N475_21270 [Pseudoalteromonas luteoviolacea DSM 6061]